MVKKGEKNLKINYLKEKCINNCNKNLQKKRPTHVDLLFFAPPLGLEPRTL